MADPRIKPDGIDQGDLCQALYETVAIMISGTVCTVANFTISVYDKARLNRTGPTTETKPLYVKPTGIDQGYLADLLYEIGVGVITTLTHAAATYFTTGVFNQAGDSIGIFTGGRVLRPNGIDMPDLAQFLYEAVYALINAELLAASSWTMDFIDNDGNLTGKND